MLMPGNGKVFISHAHEDSERCTPLLHALENWGVDYWFDAERMRAGSDLTISLQEAIAGCDIFIRMCTVASQRSYWVRLETAAFRGLQADAHKYDGDDTRVIINLILDTAYQREPFDFATLFIDAASNPEGIWLDELRRALGVTAPTSPPAPRPLATMADDHASVHVASSLSYRMQRIGLQNRWHIIFASTVAILLLGSLYALAFATRTGWLSGAGTNNARATPTIPIALTMTPTPAPSPSPYPTWSVANTHFRATHLPGWTMTQDTTGVRFAPPHAGSSAYIAIVVVSDSYSQANDQQLVSADAVNHFLHPGYFANIAQKSQLMTWTVGGTTGARQEYSYYPTDNDAQNGINITHVALLAMHYKGQVYEILLVALEAQWQDEDSSDFEPFIQGLALTS